MQPSHCRISDFNTLIRSVVHTYHPELNEPIFVHYQDLKETNISFEVNHIGLYKDSILKNILSNVQSSQKIAP